MGRPPLAVCVQVNTSGEESKHGVEPADCLALARHIHEECKHLRLAGLMTIGQPGMCQARQGGECGGCVGVGVGQRAST